MWLGVAGFAGALAVGVYLTARGGWPILAFAVLGGLAAIFYVAPPIRWAYRGLGETGHRACRTARGWCSAASTCTRAPGVRSTLCWRRCVPGFLIMALAVVNAIPDFHQDRLVGKRNLVVRRRPAARRVAVPRACRGGTRRCSGRRGRWACSPLRVASRRWRRCRCSSRAGATPSGRIETPRGSCRRSAASSAAIRRGRALHRRRSRCRAGRPWADHRIDRLGAPLFVVLADHARLRPLRACIAAPSRRPASACRTSSTPTRRCALADEIVRNDVPYVMLCGGEPLVSRISSDRRSARPRRHPAQDRNQRPALRRGRSPNGSRGCRSGRSRSASTATPRTSTSASAPAARSPRRTPPAAPSAPRACRWRSPSRRPGSTSTRPRRSSTARVRWAHSASTPGKLMRIGTAARLWDKLAPTAEQYAAFRAMLDGRRGSLERNGTLL